MPIYEYRCDSCGHQKEHLQKLSDPLLTTCPACGKESYNKLLSAAGFQLKGNGWYATDFRGSTSGAGGTSAPATSPAEAAAPAASDGPAPAGGCGGGCACH